MTYEIHPCLPQEKGELQQFIDRHWKQEHPLAVSDELLDFQHRAPDGSYRFLVARNTVSGEIDGVMGYIPTAQYDPELAANGDYFGAIWKVRDDVANDDIRLLGVFLWRSVRKLPGFRTYFTAGISDIARQFYQAAGLTVGYLRQYYILNSAVSDYRIAQIPAGRTAAAAAAGNVRIADVGPDAAAGVRYPYYPAKSVGFLVNRYARHPVYRYDFRGVFADGRLQAVLVTRTVEARGAKCLRIVDIYGDVAFLPPLSGAIQALLDSEGAEYADCMNYGIDPEEFIRIGFAELDPDDAGVTIPNYFEPFVPENIRLECVHTPGPFVIFKGDGDQDRPNILPARL